MGAEGNAITNRDHDFQLTFMLRTHRPLSTLHMNLTLEM